MSAPAPRRWNSHARDSKPPSLRAKCSREKLESLDGPQPFRNFHARASLAIVARSTLKLLAMTPPCGLKSDISRGLRSATSGNLTVLRCLATFSVAGQEVEWR